MSQAIKCDRCGKYSEVLIGEGRRGVDRFLDGAHVGNYDLCATCDEIFIGWIKAPAILEQPKIIHGVNCEKVEHQAGGFGYTHAAGDDGIHCMDFQYICGRCHTFVTREEAEQARRRAG